MKHYGLIGYPLSHSFSKKYFFDKFQDESIEATYQNFEIKDLSSIKELVNEKNLSGFNVTIPFKEKIIDYLDSLDKVAQDIGSVNCVKVIDNKLIGHNTDIIGIEHSLNKLKADSSKNALILGTGGASKAVAYVLNKLKINFQLVSRNEIQNGITYTDLNQDILNEFQILINTTPVGMFPNVDEELKIPYKYIGKKHIAFDLIYNPKKTKFLEFCNEQGANTMNGMEMLIVQANESYKIFTK